MAAGMETLEPGMHAMLLYRDRQEQFAAMAAYVRLGLDRNERCFYIAGDNSVRMVIEEFERAGIDVIGAEKRGQLTITSHRETYLKGGHFEPAQIAGELTEEIRKSLRDGFTAMRGTGEMGWATSRSDALSRLYEYEALIDEGMSRYFLALCQYDERLFNPVMISRMFRIHSMVLTRGMVIPNSHYVGPEKFLINGLAHLTVEDVVQGGR